MRSRSEIARKIVVRGIRDDWRPTKKIIRRAYRLKPDAADEVIRRAKEIAKAEYGILWAFDPGPTGRTDKGFFRVAPSHECNVRSRMVHWNMTHIQKSVTGTLVFPNALRAMGDLTESKRKEVVNLIGSAHDSLGLARDVMCAEIGGNDRDGELVEA